MNDQKDPTKTDLVKAESTWLEPAIKTKQDLINWILTGLGWPLISIELSEDQLNWVIQNSLEKYSKYAFFPEKYLIVNLKYYIKNKLSYLKII